MAPFRVRKRIRLPRSSYHRGNAFFITIRAYRRYPWFRVHTELTEQAIRILQSIVCERRSRLYAWCIMQDHIHLLLQDRDVVGFVRLLKGRMTPEARVLERDRRLWQRSFHDHGIRKDEALESFAVYIWENPVRSGMVDHPTEYEWAGSEEWPDWRGFFGRG